MVVHSGRASLAAERALVETVASDGDAERFKHGVDVEVAEAGRGTATPTVLLGHGNLLPAPPGGVGPWVAGLAIASARCQ